jgi:hypothetical protein
VKHRPPFADPGRHRPGTAAANPARIRSAAHGGAVHHHRQRGADEVAVQASAIAASKPARSIRFLARIYGELLKVLGDDAAGIGDGGHFVSFAGKYVEPARPSSQCPKPTVCKG